MKVALYLRVSTARQAEKDLSIPDQRNQLERWCKEKKSKIVAEYVEPGASATDDKRPQFQRMMDDATRPDRPFDAVLVHSFSRFFRDSFKFEMHRRSLPGKCSASSAPCSTSISRRRTRSTSSAR
jgi:site-specific DNA recombinase